MFTVYIIILTVKHEQRTKLELAGMIATKLTISLHYLYYLFLFAICFPV